MIKAKDTNLKKKKTQPYSIFHALQLCVQTLLPSYISFGTTINLNYNNTTIFSFAVSMSVSKFKNVY